MTYYNKHVEVFEGNVVEATFVMKYIKWYYAIAKLNCTWLQSAKVQLSPRIGFDKSFSEYSPECNSNATIQYSRDSTSNACHNSIPASSCQI
jgi:hypothetical protein